MKTLEGTCDSTLRLSTCCVFFAIAASGCANVTTYAPDGRMEVRSQAEFETYAESVFRRQNEAGSQLVYIYTDLESIDDASYKAITSSEERMLQACEPVNQMAVLMLNQEEPDFFFKIHFMNSLSACDVAASELELLLKKADYSHPQEDAAAEAGSLY
jgi:hypothetical protein